MKKFLLLFLLMPVIYFATPLDRYIQLPDPSYRFEVTSKQESADMTIYVLKLDSLTWRSESEVNQPQWTHTLVIATPKNSSSKDALMIIQGGMLGSATPDASMELEAAIKASKLGMTVATLSLIPNQSLVFSDEEDARYKTEGRREDALVAYTWDKFLKTEDPTWLVRLPMTKAVIRAMDTVQKIVPGVEGFIVMGASKRGWTAWTVAAADSRVKLIIPVVIDLLNLKTAFIRHYEAYGQWSFVLRDYEDAKIPERWQSPEFTKLMKIEEPYEYKERFTMPKFILNASGDEFFLPDSSQLYFHDLPGESYLCYMPNQGHYLDREAQPTVEERVFPFIAAFEKNMSLPKIEWKKEGNQLLLKTTSKPLKVLLWSAWNPKGRDFRAMVVGKIWQNETLQPQADGSYLVDLKLPERGWKAYFIECYFEGATPDLPLIFTTDVFIVPDVFPFEHKKLPGTP